MNEKCSLSEPKRLKISVWSIQVNWEKCKGATKNNRKTEENIRLLTALFSCSIENVLQTENGSERTIHRRKCIWGNVTLIGSPVVKMPCVLASTLYTHKITFANLFQSHLISQNCFFPLQAPTHPWESQITLSEPLMFDGRRCFMTHVKFPRQTM